MKKYLVIFITLLLTVVVGCSANKDVVEESKSNTAANGGKTAVVSLGSNPNHFNNNISDAGDGGYVAANVFNSLIARDFNNDLLPDLAHDWEISKDAKKYTFYLEEDVKWHDGEPFTSKDVKWTIDAIVERKGFIYEQLSMVDSVETPNDYIVEINLSEANSALLSVLAQVTILPSHLYEGEDWVTTDLNKKPIGTGAFKFVEHKQNVSVILEANDDYFKGPPNLERLIFSIIPDENTVVQSFLNGEIDIIDYGSALSPGAVPEIEAQPDSVVVKEITNDRQYMIMNFDKKPWDDLRVRKAFAYAIDRDELVLKAHKGYAERAEGFYTPKVEWAYNDVDKMPERDIEKAKQLLDEAGITPDANGVRMDGLEILIFEFPVFNDIAKVVQANLKEIGIESSISSLEYSAWDEKVRNSDYQVTILGGNWGDDPESLFVRVGTNGAMNLMNYSNSEIDNLLVEGKKAVDKEKRAIIYKDIQRHMSEELPLLPLTEWMILVAMKDYISGHPINDGKGKVGMSDYSLIDIKN